MTSREDGNMLGDLGEWLAARIGQPIPCALCQTPTPASQLRETLVPGAIAFGGTVVVHSIVWVCPSCPGELYQPQKGGTNR